MKEQTFSRAVESGGKLMVRSALNPILWLCAIITVPTLLAGAIRPSLPWWVTAVGCSPVVVALFGFIFLLLFDRDKLQSEEFQIKKRTIELAQQKSDPAPLTVDLEKVTSNPDVKTLAGPSEAGVE